MPRCSPACVVERLFQNLTKLFPVDVDTEPDEGDACLVLICIRPVILSPSSGMDALLAVS